MLVLVLCVLHVVASRIAFSSLLYHSCDLTTQCFDPELQVVKTLRQLVREAEIEAGGGSLDEVIRLE